MLNNRRARAFLLLIGLACASALACFNVGYTKEGRSPPLLPRQEISISGLPFEGKRHGLRIGFNLGPLQSVHGKEYPSLQKLRRDGFRFIRVYELWQRRSTIDKLVSNLERLVDLGFIPIVSFSNFPYPDHALSTAPPNGGSRLTQEQTRQRARAYRFSNRYPPEDLDEYLSDFSRLIAALERRFAARTMEEWLFELGNEPAAPKFYWGTPQQYHALVERSAGLLKQRNQAFTTGFGGFSTRFVQEYPGSEPYYRVMASLLKDKDLDFLSFHIYQDKFQTEESLRKSISKLVHRAAGKRAVITEWNPGSKGRRHTQEILDSPRFMGYLVQMSAICQEFGIDLLVVHKVLDNPPRDRKGKVRQLGLIKEDGTEKNAYSQLVRARPILEQGFQVARTKNLVALGTPESMILYAKAPSLTFDARGYHIEAASSISSDETSFQMKSGDWVVLRRLRHAEIQ